MSITLSNTERLYNTKQSSHTNNSNILDGIIGNTNKVNDKHIVC